MVRVRYSALAKLFALVVFILIIIPSFMRYFDESSSSSNLPASGGDDSGGGSGGEVRVEKPRKNKADSDINRSEITVAFFYFLLFFYC